MNDDASTSGNRTLNKAKAAKQDEFYTQYVDIEKEVAAYLEYDPDTFRGKVVYCNCDDPFESNFFKYFAVNFNRLGLKKLIATSYDGSPFAGEQLALPEFEEGNGDRDRPKAIAITLDAVTGGAADIDDVKLFLEQNPHTRTPLTGGGDFRSPECVALLKQADIVVTNPPFSLFRAYVAQLVEHGKKFLIIGNVNAITYKEIFPLIMEGRLWLGVTMRHGTREFCVPDHYLLHAGNARVDENGVKYINMPSARWFTNLPHGYRPPLMPLMTMEDNLKSGKHKGKAMYDRYDNYDAIEVPYVSAIPSDYDGAMGVPVTFLDKYNPDQFEILGVTARGCHDRVPETKRYNDYWGVRQDGSTFGISGTIVTDHAKLLGNAGHKCYYVNAEGRVVHAPYKRIFIRHRRRAGKIGENDRHDVAQY